MGRNTRATTTAPLGDSQKSTQDYVNINQNSQNELCFLMKSLCSDQIGEDEFKPKCRIPVGKIVFLLTKTEDIIAANLLNTQAPKLNFITWDTAQKTTKSSIPSQFGLITVLKQSSQNYIAQNQEI